MKYSHRTVGIDDFCCGGVELIKGSAFVNSRGGDIRDSDSSASSERFFREIRHTEVVQKEFSV
jgi:hypothetical protein